MTELVNAAVVAANSKLAQFLRRKEEEEMLLQIGKKRPKQIKEEKLPVGRSRWGLDPDFRAPTPLVDRPRSVDGATSFHFSFTRHSMKGVPTSGGQPLPGYALPGNDLGFDHSKYIERDGAAEVSLGADHAVYLERPGAVERVREVAATHSLDEAVAQELLLSSSALTPLFGIPSVFSNISDDPFERQEYWRAVEREATPAKKHRILLDPTISPSWWDRLAHDDEIDVGFRIHALGVRDKYRQHLSDQDAGRTSARFKPQSYNGLNVEAAGQILVSAARLLEDGSPAPFRFKSGAGGILQFRLVAELPHELSAEDRALIVQNFCDLLGELEERDGKKVGMKYTAVIHAPDAHNDKRNYHLHLIAHHRPAEFIEELGLWDFEVVEHYVDPGSGKERNRHPFRQKTIGGVDRTPDAGDPEKTGLNFIPYLRKEFARITNEVLAARGIDRRLDPRRYEEMKIDRTPTEHLGNSAAALEAIGVSTVRGSRNAVSIWNDAEREIRRQVVIAAKAHASRNAELQKLHDDVMAIDQVHPHLPAFRKLLAERMALTRDLPEDQGEILVVEHLEAKAKSRAVRTRQTCVQFLVDIERGDADRSTISARSQIEERWRAARAHLDAIDAAMSPYRPLLRDAAEEIERQAKRLAVVDEDARELIKVLEQRLEWARRFADNKGKERQLELARSSTAKSLGPKIQEVDARPAVASVRPETAEGTEGSIQTASPGISVQPVTIEGNRIAEPILHPVDLKPAITGTPDGLTPLRQTQATSQVQSQPEVVVTNIDAPVEVHTPASEGSADDASERIAAAPLTAGLSAEQPSHDKASVEAEGLAAAERQSRLPVSRPALIGQSEAPQSSAPSPASVAGEIKEQTPTTSATLAARFLAKHTGKAQVADRSGWDDLMTRITANRITVKAEKLSNGNMRFTVPSLGPRDRQLLHASRFAHRTNNRLAAIHERQQQEIQRVVRWVKTQGQNPVALVLENKTASLGEGVRDTVRTLFRNWGNHELVIAAIREESDRRMELAKAVARQPARAPKPVDLDREQRKAEAARIYPTPDQAYTREVADFIRLLRGVAPEKDLQAAADKIHASASAREDVNKHTVELATAYRLYGETTYQHGTSRCVGRETGR